MNMFKNGYGRFFNINIVIKTIYEYDNRYKMANISHKHDAF